MSASEVDPLPPRDRWEEPPIHGWRSHLGGLGLETLALLGGFAAVAGGWKLFALARRLDADASGGWARLLVVLLWGSVLLCGASLILYVWRRLGGFALMAAMLTDHGRVARFGGRPPIWLDEPPPVGLRVAHLSDLHLTEGDRIRTVERARPGGNVALRALLGRRELSEADVVIITGDITDRGTNLAWRQAEQLLNAAGVTDRVILVPGNHDLSLVDPWGGWRDPDGHWRRNDRYGIVQLANLLKFCTTFARTGGGARGHVLHDGQAVPYADAWPGCEAEVRPFIESLPDLPVPRQRLGRGYGERSRALEIYANDIATARRRLLALFPIAVPLPGKDSVIFVLNSCTPVARHTATNALGRIGSAQYRRLDRLAGLFPQAVKVFALHHHTVRRAEEQSHRLGARIMAKFTVLGDARPLVRLCRKHHVRAVLNGHRHLSYQLRLPNGTVLMAAPSSTFGDELAHDPRPQFERYDIAPTITEPTVGVFRRVVRMGLATPQALLPAVSKSGS